MLLLGVFRAVATLGVGRVAAGPRLAVGVAETLGVPTVGRPGPTEG